MPLGLLAWEGKGEHRVASQETCRRHASLESPRVEGEKDGTMTTASASLGASVSRQSRLLQLALAGLLGLFVVGFVGFSHIDAVHNAAHDYRHSMAFPCH